MSWLDWALLALVLGYCGWLIFRPKRRPPCCGDCGHCSGCK